jgi:hypothetical protein
LKVRGAKKRKESRSSYYIGPVITAESGRAMRTWQSEGPFIPLPACVGELVKDIDHDSLKPFISARELLKLLEDRPDGENPNDLQ